MPSSEGVRALVEVIVVFVVSKVRFCWDLEVGLDEIFEEILEEIDFEEIELAFDELMLEGMVWRLETLKSAKKTL